SLLTDGNSFLDYVDYTGDLSLAMFIPVTRLSRFITDLRQVISHQQQHNELTSQLAQFENNCFSSKTLRRFQVFEAKQLEATAKELVSVIRTDVSDLVAQDSTSELLQKYNQTICELIGQTTKSGSFDEGLRSLLVSQLLGYLMYEKRVLRIFKRFQ